MNIYNLFRQYAHIGGGRTKLLILCALHVFRRRYLGIYIDPVLGCNYRCQMCYFSDEKIRKARRGRMTEAQIDNTAKALFSRALKLQIGCGAEPSIDLNGTMQLVRLGAKYGVPYISMTSNGVLLTYPILRELVETGLNELTISLHGVHRETYERLMGPTSNYDAFLVLLENIRKIKQQYPKFVVRINYTMNADNVDELSDFDNLFADTHIDVLQLRPIRNLGVSQYQNFSLEYISKCLETIVRPLAERCREKHIQVLFPEQINIERFEGKKKEDIRERMVSNFVYYNITAQSYSKQNVHLDTEDYAHYSRRTHIGWQMLKAALLPQNEEQEISLSTPLNYDIT